ncbi:MAG: hypothetical protein ACLUNQ_09035 [Oscillospiraceae bacterium]
MEGAGQVPCFLRNITAVPTAIACANAALGGCETLTSLMKWQRPYCELA